MKNYPFRYPEELDKDIDYLQSLAGYGASKNKALQDSVQIAAASVRKTLWGHSKDTITQKGDVVRKKFGLTKIFGRRW